MEKRWPLTPFGRGIPTGRIVGKSLGLFVSGCWLSVCSYRAGFTGPHQTTDRPTLFESIAYGTVQVFLEEAWDGITMFVRFWGSLSFDATSVMPMPEGMFFRRYIFFPFVSSICWLGHWLDTMRIIRIVNCDNWHCSSFFCSFRVEEGTLSSFWFFEKKKKKQEIEIAG